MADLTQEEKIVIRKAELAQEEAARKEKAEVTEAGKEEDE